MTISPSRWLMLTVAFLLGIIFWAGFESTLAYTNTTDFCLSCHEMSQSVGKEYLESTHYKTPSGAGAGCSDCHVPQQFFAKVWRKIKASREVYHTVLGTIDTPEKFEEHRLELAERVWARMEATDSRECRNCHNYGRMDFHKQSDRGQKKMKQAMERGTTCIECHKGLTHNLPEGYREDD